MYILMAITFVLTFLNITSALAEVTALKELNGRYNCAEATKRWVPNKTPKNPGFFGRDLIKIESGQDFFIVVNGPTIRTQKDLLWNNEPYEFTSINYEARIATTRFTFLQSNSSQAIYSPSIIWLVVPKPYDDNMRFFINIVSAEQNHTYLLQAFCKRSQY